MNGQANVRKVALTDFVDLLESGSRPKGGVTDIGEIPSLGAEHLNDQGGISFIKKKMISTSFFERLSKGKIEIGDILIVKDGATTGKVSLVGNDFEFKTAAINEHLFRLKPKPELDSKFLFYYLFSAKGKSEILKDFRGATVGGISRSFTDNIKIPLPHLETQKKIAAILDKADELMQNDKKILEKYNQLAQCVFLDMFGDPVRNEKGWETKTIEELSQKSRWAIKRGPFGGALKKEIFVDDGYLVYEQYHALNNNFTFERYFIDEQKFQELKAFEVKPQDIIISCSGVYLGKLAIIPENAKKGIINQALLKITLNQNIMINEFFIYHFTYKNFKEKFFKSNRGAGIPNFPPMTEFKKFPFITPPIKDQVRFYNLLQNIEKQKAISLQSLQKSEELFQSLLQRAFKGELIE